ncbi:sugar-binding transcriptional regulator [Zafaria sp. J156]
MKRLGNERIHQGRPEDADPVRDAQVLRSAQLYYLQDLTMDAIARELRVSRSTVSRLIARARQTGVVSFVINKTGSPVPELEGRIADRYGISVHAVPTDRELGEAQVLERVAVQASEVLANLVGSDMIVGVAWGATVSAISRHLKPLPTRGTVVVQLNGSGNVQSSGIAYASDILQRFGAAFGARIEQFPVPTFFDDARTRDMMWRERSVRRVLDLQGHMGLVVFGLGTVDADVPSHVYRGGYLTAEDLAEIRDRGVVGDVATTFFTSDGSTDAVGLNRRSTGPSLEVLRRVPRRVCAVAGRSKVPALAAALEMGLVTDLVLDEAAAAALLDLLDSRDGAGMRA